MAGNGMQLWDIPAKRLLCDANAGRFDVIEFCWDREKCRIILRGFAMGRGQIRVLDYANNRPSK